MSSTDQLQRFIFDEADVRGVLVGLEGSYQESLEKHGYPAAVRRLLGEMLAAVSLLSSTLKFEGRLSLQARGDGVVSMLMAECTRQNHLRGIARVDGDAVGDSLVDLLGQGQLVITIEPDQGKPYQGVVPLEKPHLAQCLEQYFADSEQLATRIMLCADDERAAGMLLQALPSNDEGERYAENWSRVAHLGSTLTEKELLELDNETLLFRLFHEETVRVFDPSSLAFQCDCSKERCLGALRTLSDVELEEMLSEQGTIEMDCQFCKSRYQIDRIEVEQLRRGSAESGSSSIH
ncbi:MAG: Hsp33 family molecular chaperone HslO [Halopseudomonas sp.]